MIRAVCFMRVLAAKRQGNVRGIRVCQNGVRSKKAYGARYASSACRTSEALFVRTSIARRAFAP